MPKTESSTTLVPGVPRAPSETRSECFSETTFIRPHNPEPKGDKNVLVSMEKLLDLAAKNVDRIKDPDPFAHFTEQINELDASIVLSDTETAPLKIESNDISAMLHYMKVTGMLAYQPVEYQIYMQNNVQMQPIKEAQPTQYRRNGEVSIPYDEEADENGDQPATAVNSQYSSLPASSPSAIARDLSIMAPRIDSKVSSFINGLPREFTPSPLPSHNTPSPKPPTPINPADYPIPESHVNAVKAELQKKRSRSIATSHNDSVNPESSISRTLQALRCSNNFPMYYSRMWLLPIVVVIILFTALTKYVESATTTSIPSSSSNFTGSSSSSTQSYSIGSTVTTTIRTTTLSGATAVNETHTSEPQGSTIPSPPITGTLSSNHVSDYSTVSSSTTTTTSDIRTTSVSSNNSLTSYGTSESGSTSTQSNYESTALNSTDSTYASQSTSRDDQGNMSATILSYSTTSSALITSRVSTLTDLYTDTDTYTDGEDDNETYSCAPDNITTTLLSNAKVFTSTITHIVYTTNTLSSGNDATDKLTSSKKSIKMISSSTTTTRASSSKHSSSAPSSTRLDKTSGSSSKHPTSSTTTSHKLTSAISKTKSTSSDTYIKRTTTTHTSTKPTTLTSTTTAASYFFVDKASTVVAPAKVGTITDATVSDNSILITVKAQLTSTGYISMHLEYTINSTSAAVLVATGHANTVANSAIGNALSAILSSTSGSASPSVNNPLSISTYTGTASMKHIDVTGGFLGIVPSSSHSSTTTRKIITSITTMTLSLPPMIVKTVLATAMEIVLTTVIASLKVIFQTSDAPLLKIGKEICSRLGIPFNGLMIMPSSTFRTLKLISDHTYMITNVAPAVHSISANKYKVEDMFAHYLLNRLNLCPPGRFMHVKDYGLCIIEREYKMAGYGTFDVANNICLVSYILYLSESVKDPHNYGIMPNGRGVISRACVKYTDEKCPLIVPNGGTLTYQRIKDDMFMTVLDMYPILDTAGLARVNKYVSRISERLRMYNETTPAHVRLEIMTSPQSTPLSLKEPSPILNGTEEYIVTN
ncbi:hypothetical protein HDU82_006766 [Entophlyctis luteolus]|nr:hypothetical protein HDU82_006766 [Entophlyctis luteolus]